MRDDIADVVQQSFSHSSTARQWLWARDPLAAAGYADVVQKRNAAVHGPRQRGVVRLSAAGKLDTAAACSDEGMKDDGETDASRSSHDELCDVDLDFTSFDDFCYDRMSDGCGSNTMVKTKAVAACRAALTACLVSGGRECVAGIATAARGAAAPNCASRSLPSTPRCEHPALGILRVPEQSSYQSWAKQASTLLAPLKVAVNFTLSLTLLEKQSKSNGSRSGCRTMRGDEWRQRAKLTNPFLTVKEVSVLASHQLMDATMSACGSWKRHYSLWLSTQSSGLMLRQWSLRLLMR